MNRKHCLAAIALAAAATAATTGHAAEFILYNGDPAKIGFNDTTPVAPVGGNPGTTLGQQRLLAFQHALGIWGRTLRSNVKIAVLGSFGPRDCTATGGVLASAGATMVFRDFPGAPLRGHWYGSALADSLAGEDLGLEDPSEVEFPYPDIQATFNGNMGKPGCLEASTWYYGFDNKAGPGQIDFLDTFLHEVSHGLGFQNFVTETTGAHFLGMPDVYSAFTLDLTNRLSWNTMTPAQIRASAVRDGKIVWTGPAVTANAPLILNPWQDLKIGGAQQATLAFGGASFGPAPTVTNLSGTLALALDAATVTPPSTTTDGCTAILSNVGGKVALVDRGSCTFAVKAANAQAAGATALLIANSAAGVTAFSPGGADPSITIPVVGISYADGQALRASLTGGAQLTAAIVEDPTRRIGTAEGYVRLYAPTTVALGSSISHFDTPALPNLLMEPFSTQHPRSAMNLDLTPALMTDIGWKLETTRVGNCDTGVPNALADGTLVSALIAQCAGNAKNLGQAQSCMSHATNQLRAKGLISGAQHGAIASCMVNLKK